MLAVIPARGGSKGLPGKNVRPLCGKPLIGYTIDAALAAKTITRVIVSTDDPEIAEVAVRLGAEVPFLRPSELASDTAQAIDTYIHTLDLLARDEGYVADALVALLPTAPLRTPADIDGAVRVYRDKAADSVVSYFPSPYPIEWFRRIGEDGQLQLVSDLALPDNRQRSEQHYLPNGAVYVFRCSMLKEQRVYYTDRSYAYLMPRERSVDIDDQIDFALAEFLLAQRKQWGPREREAEVKS